MDTNTKTQLTNIFAKGMNTDVSDALLGNDQYRLANNLRYVTDDEENTGEMHVIEGAKRVISKSGLPGKVRGMVSIREYGAVVVEDDNSWSVYRFEQPNNLSLVALIQNSDYKLEDSKKSKLSLVTKYEDDENIKLYIADGKSSVMVVNLMSRDIIRDYLKIVSYPAAVLAPPQILGLINGTLKEGVVQYSYLLYNTWGTASNASIATRLIPLHNKEPQLTNTKNFKGFELGKVSNKGVSLKITIDGELLQHFTNLIIYRITYVEAGQPPLIEKIVDTKIDDNYTLNDTGYEALETLTLEEYNGISGIHIIPKVIESKDDYMFAANIKTSQTELDKRLAGFKFECKLTDPGIYDMKTPLLTVEGEYHGEIVSWKFIKQELVGDENGIKEELIKLSPEGYANPMNCINYPSLRRDELYRYGIILYDDKGNNSSVFWIADIRTPSVFTNNGEYKTFYIHEGVLKTVALGIEFTVNLSDILDITGYEIVRCNRTVKDIATIAQGVISRPGRRFSIDLDYMDKYPLTPSGWLTTANIVMNVDGAFSTDDDWERWNYSNCELQSSRVPALKNCTKNINNGIYLFICPEYCYQDESSKALIEKDGLYIKQLTYLYPNSFDGCDINENNTEIKTDSFDTATLTSYGQSTIEWSYAEGRVNLLMNRMIVGNNKANVFYAIDSEARTPIMFWPGYTQTVMYFADNTQYMFDETSIPIIRDNPEDLWKVFDNSDRHQYVKLYNSADIVESKKLSNSTSVSQLDPIDVDDTSFAKALNWDDMAQATSPNSQNETYPLKYIDLLVNIGDDGYVNWTSGNLYNAPIMKTSGAFFLANDQLTKWVNAHLGTMMGPAGKTVLFKIDINKNNASINSITDTTRISGGDDHSIRRSYMGTYLCNLRQNVTPYGGNSDEAKKLSNYYSHGYYTNDSTISVYDGDCYIQPFEYVSLHKWYHNKVEHPRNSCIVYSIPVETNINLAYTYGYEFSKNFSNSGNATNLQDQPSDVYGFFTQDTPLYQYNGAYSSENKLKQFAAYQDDPTNINNEDYRCYYSNPKSNNEAIDNWTIYQPANFLDVDTRKGPITGLRTFHNSLVFWQRDATGLFSVNERTTITDDSNMPLLLGTGGVLARYDYIKTSNGMKENEFADTQSDSTLYWWDHNKADLCAYAGGEDMIVLSKVKNVANFLNKQDKLDKLSDEPMLTFDKKYNEMIAYVTDGEGHEAGSMVYSEQTQAFVGLYAIMPRYALSFADELYLHQKDGLYVWNKSSDKHSKGLNSEALYPYLKYVVNDNQLMNKVFDNVTFGARVYGGGYMEENKRNHDKLENLDFTFSTPLKQKSTLNGKDIENVEYDFRFAIPRNAGSAYGDRMRGKTMQCELESKSNSLDLSIQYITTKYRISWS